MDIQVTDLCFFCTSTLLVCQDILLWFVDNPISEPCIEAELIEANCFTKIFTYLEL